MTQTPFDEFGEYKKLTPPKPFIKLPDPTNPDIPTPDYPRDDADDEEAILASPMPLREAFLLASNLNLVYLPKESSTPTPAAYPAERDSLDDPTSLPDDPSAPTSIEAPSSSSTVKRRDYKKYLPHFLYVPLEKIRKTFENTTQYATNVMSGPHIRQTIKSPYPALNVARRNEDVMTDTVYAEVPAIGTNGQTMAQIFVGRSSHVTDVFGMTNEDEFINTLSDVVRKRGAMDTLVSDHAQVEMSKRVNEFLREYIIRARQTEPNYQHQNFAEHRYNHMKRHHKFIMNYRKVEACAWLLCLNWISDVMNMTSEKSLGWRTPLEVLTGQTTDISIALIFVFWDKVIVSRYEDSSYSGGLGTVKESEISGRFVGFSWNVGHALTFLILTDDTRKIISRSRVKLANVPENKLIIDMKDEVKPEHRPFIRSKLDPNDDPSVSLPTIDISNNPIRAEYDRLEQEEKQAVEIGEQPTQDPSQPTEQPVVETVEDENVGEEYSSPMEHPPLKDLRPPEELDPEDELPEHLRKDPTQDKNVPEVDFTLNSLKNPNPVETGLSPDELIDRTFLMPPQSDGTRHRARIIEKIEEHREGMQDHPDLIKFRCSVNGDEYHKVVAYNDIVDFIEQDQTWDGTWKFREILDHNNGVRRRKSYEGLDDKDVYKGSSTNVLVEWESGERTWEPLYNQTEKNGIYNYDPVSIAIYASDHNLLNTPGWKLPGLKSYVKSQKKLLRLANQAKLHSFRTKPIYMFGVEVPRNYEQAMELDRRNGNTLWADATALELGQIDDYETFKDLGEGGHPGQGYKKINVHLVYAVKHDGRRKARLVAGGHLTDTPIDSVYSSVVSLRGIRILAFISQLNEEKLWATDIGNAYLESLTKEKVYIIAGPEFGDREGHTLVVIKALYGLKSSGLRWSERFSDVLRDMKFVPSRAEPDIWMRDKGDHYEYIAVYVDDLLIVSRDPEAITNTLTDVHKFKLKGTGPVKFHLGCDFFEDDEGNLCFAPKKYIDKICSNYERIFGKLPTKASSPLVKGDHPETDTSELLDIEDIKIYQSLIGALQWTVQIGRFDVSTAVMTMSRFRAAPRKGHLERVKRIHGYLYKMKNGIIRIRTEEPDFESFPDNQYDWAYTCYHGAKEEEPEDAPTPRGKRVLLSCYKDANLYHDLISGRSVTGILHFANRTPIDWYSKLQSTVETATFGSECVAARTAVEQIIDLRNTFRYLGVKVDQPTMLFGDNKTVVDTASIPHAKLHKRHNALSFHRVREAIVAKIIKFFHLPGETNPADILSKHWDYASVWSQLKPLLFWYGNMEEKGDRG